MEWSFVMACRQFCHWEQDNKANGEDSSDWMRGGGACDEGGAAVALEEVVGVNVCRRLPFLGAMGRAALRDGGGGCVIVVVIIVSSFDFGFGRRSCMRHAVPFDSSIDRAVISIQRKRKFPENLKFEI